MNYFNTFCYSGLDDDVKGLADFKAEQVYQACLVCLKEIANVNDAASPVNSLSSVLPRGMSAKVNTTSELATIIKGLGYKQDMNYHQLLYPTVPDLRKLFTWLLDTMPKKQWSQSDGMGSGGGQGNGKTIITLYTHATL